MSVRAAERTSIHELYHTSLDQRLKRGDTALVCQEQALCERVQNLLAEADVRLFFKPLALEPLAVMEASLLSSGLGLEGLGKAFEILELAALNLYLYPWRKEYRTIKVFSGAYTHLVQPVLSLEQAAMLFGLLGYQQAEGQSRGHQLELKGLAPSKKELRRLACAFFAARCECHLLLSAARSPGGGPIFQWALVQERQKGRGLQEATDNARKQCEVQGQGTLLEGELDLYTAGNCNGESQSDRLQERAAPFCRMSLSQSGISLPSTQDEAARTLHCSQQETTVKSGQTEMSGGEAGQQTAPQAPRSDSVSIIHKLCLLCKGEGRSETVYCCEQCCVLHSLNCTQLEKCERQGHHTRRTGDNTTQQVRAGGVLDPKEGEKVAPQVEGYACLTHGATPSLACHTCISAHDHVVRYKVLPEPREPPGSLSLTQHSCNSSNFACLSCLLLHSISCDKAKLCIHKQHNVLLKCTVRKDCEGAVYVVCSNCHLAYCKMCWYRNPLSCQCGQNFSNPASEDLAKY